MLGGGRREPALLGDEFAERSEVGEIDASLARHVVDRPAPRATRHAVGPHPDDEDRRSVYRIHTRILEPERPKCVRSIRPRKFVYVFSKRGGFCKETAFTKRQFHGTLP